MSILRNDENQTLQTELPVFPKHFAKMALSEFQGLLERRADRLDLFFESVEKKQLERQFSRFVEGLSRRINA